MVISQEERIIGNGFDIISMSKSQLLRKQEMLTKNCVIFIIDNNITNFADFFIAFNDSFANNISM